MKLALLFLTGCLAVAQQQPPAGELESRDAPVKFTSRVNLVPLTVVVRDSRGKAVGNLTRDDFRLFDNGKPQVITRFSIEKPGAPVVLEKEVPTLEAETRPPGSNEGPPAVAPVVADHFVAYLFDDVHVKFEDMARARDAAGKVLATSLAPADRVAIYTTSGQVMLEFTADRDKLQETLLRLRPTPVTGGIGHGLDCPDISYYMADRIVNLNDAQALQIALMNYQACSNNPYATANEVMGYAQTALHNGEHETKLAISVLNSVVRRISGMPGQRNIVLASPGFLVTVDYQQDVTEVLNRAVRANVVVSTLDARGLWTPPQFDASRPTPAGGPQALTMMGQYLQSEALAQEDVLSELADGTGGTWFHANNDLGEGFRRLAATPEFIYVLAFTPENLKSDGKFHKLKIALKDPNGLTLQARKGYYAPKHETAQTDLAEQEIVDAVFSREVMKEIPVTMHTQFFKSGDQDAKLSVIAQVDVKSLKYRKEDGRNRNDLTVIAAVFDSNGNMVGGLKKHLEMRLKDATLTQKLASGIGLKFTFDVKTGQNVVRLVVRDSEGQMMASDNAVVEIP